MTTHYSVGTMVLLSYNATTEAFYAADYDSNGNTTLRVYRQDSSSYNADYPLIASRTKAADLGTVGTESSYEAAYGLISDTDANIPTTNPYTGLTKVKELATTNKVAVGNSYKLPPCYNYSSGHLLKLSTAGSNTHLCIKITGYAYNYSGDYAPINSIFELYDYSGGIVSASGVHYGSNIGNISLFRYNGYTYAHIPLYTAYSIYSFEIMSSAAISPIVTNAAKPSSGTSGDITLTCAVAPSTLYIHRVKCNGIGASSFNFRGQLTFLSTSKTPITKITAAIWGSAVSIVGSMCYSSTANYDLMAGYTLSNSPYVTVRANSGNTISDIAINLNTTQSGADYVYDLSGNLVTSASFSV